MLFAMCFTVLKVIGLMEFWMYYCTVLISNDEAVVSWFYLGKLDHRCFGILDLKRTNDDIKTLSENLKTNKKNRKKKKKKETYLCTLY